MIKSINQIMLYMNDTKNAKEFWCEKVGFELIREIDFFEDKSYIIAVSKNSETHFVLHNKNIVKNMNPDMNLEIPSIMFDTDDLEKTIKDFREKNIFINDINDMGDFFVTNFKDNEDNYYAIKQNK